MGERDGGERIGERVGDELLERLYMQYLGTKYRLSRPGIPRPRGTTRSGATEIGPHTMRYQIYDIHTMGT